MAVQALQRGAEDDTVNGNGGDDTIDFGSGRDQVDGGSRSDVFVVNLLADLGVGGATGFG